MKKIATLIVVSLPMLACGPTSPTGVGGSGATGGTGGAGGTGGTGGTTYHEPDPDNDADWPCAGRKVRIMTHAPGNPSVKFPVPLGTADRYICANSNTPFRAGEIATYIRPIADDKRVIHHFILFGSPVPNGADQSITEACVSPNIAGIHVGGWAPGGKGGVFDADVGMKLDYPYFMLQAHYNNALYAGASDSSGLEFCAVTEPRPNIAGVITLGIDLFSIPANATNFAVNATCGNLSATGTPITIVGTSPHMHKIGAGFRTTHARGGANQGDLVNVPVGTWVFDQQTQYPMAPRRVVNPGDTFNTTCYFTNPYPYPVSFGTRTTDEMCYNFITAYPIDQAVKKCGQGITFF